MSSSPEPEQKPSPPAVVEPEEEGEEVEEDDEARRERRRKNKLSKKRARDPDEEDEEEDEDEDEEDEDEDEDEEEGSTRKHKHKKQKSNRNRFLDVEAEVDDEDEEDLDEEDDFVDVNGFIADPDPDEALSQSDRIRAHRGFDRRLLADQEEDLHDVARGLDERYKQQRGAYNPFGGSGESENIPQRMLMPSVEDANLWMLRVKPGRERNIIQSLLRKTFEKQYQANPVEVLSAFHRDSLPGIIYVEAFSAAHVTNAVNGLVGIYLSRGVTLVPIDEMAPLLKIKKQHVNVVPGMWVRIKKSIYQGDLAQVYELDPMKPDIVTVRLVPRIDLHPSESALESVRGGARKKGLTAAAKIANRPPARLFAKQDVIKAYGSKSVRVTGTHFFFNNDEFVDGFIQKNITKSGLITENVVPTLEEISMFQGDVDNSKLDLSALAESSRKTSAAVLLPGDHVEVYEGEQTGLDGVVVTVSGDTLAIRASRGPLRGKMVDLPARSVRKQFKIGDHVKVLQGKNRDESGMVVSVEGAVVTFLSDQGNKEVKAFSKDLREAAETSTGPAQVGQFELHDLVMLDTTTAAIIIKTERDSFRVLDQNGSVQVVQQHQISARRDTNSRRAVALDSQNQEMKVGDNMKEVDGEGRRGDVVQIYRSLFIFLHNREILENNGVFVARGPSLISTTPKGSAANGSADLTKMNPALQQQLPGGGASLMPPPQNTFNAARLINTNVVVTKGASKGLMGVIKDMNGENARVELVTNNRVITIHKSSLKRKDARGNTYPLEESGFGASGGYGQPQAAGGNPYAGGQTPYGGNAAYGRTPNPYADQGGKTPAWGVGRTPMHPSGGLGGATPAWGGGKTPNPYAGAGGKTPNPYGGGMGRTPNPYAVGGGKTPNPYGGGGKTPNPYAAGGKTPNPYADGGKTPNPYAGNKTPAHPSTNDNEASGSRGYGLGAPTPYNTAMSAPTPAPYAAPFSAPTPYVAPGTAAPSYGAPTPGAGGYGGAPTPYGSAGAYGAPTPGAGLSAPTPYGAPTPFAGGGGGMEDAGNQAKVVWDWALDFRNVIVEVGPSRRPGGSAARFQSGQYDGQRFGLMTALPNSQECECQLIQDPSVNLKIPAEFLHPVGPTGSGQRIVILSGQGQGQIRVTQYKDQGQWMMQTTPEHSAMIVVDEDCLCMLWK